jgi:glycosyltransferase involved in cell wall biosynthesis
VIADGHNGLLVDAGDPDGLAAAILRVVSDPAASRTMAARGLETVQRYDAGIWARKIEDEYRRAIVRCRPARQGVRP